MSRGAINNRQVVSNAIRNAVDELEHRNGVRISDVHTGVADKDIKCATHDYFVYVSRGDGEISKEDVNKLHDGMYNVRAEDNVRILERIPQIYRVYGPNGIDEVTDPVGCFGKKLAATFSFVLGNDSMIVRYENTLAGLTPKLAAKTLTAGPMFAVQATAIEDEINDGVVVLDIGRDTTDLCICKNGIVRYVRTIPLGSGDINTDVQAFGVPQSKVEGLKTAHGRALADAIEVDQTIKAGPNNKQAVLISQKTLAKLIEYRLKDIVKFVKEEIRDSGYTDKLPCGVILTGGGANLIDIDKMFARELNMEVRVACPNLHVMTPEGREEMVDKLEYATVIGMLHNAKAKGLYNHVEVIRSVTPVVEPVATTPVATTPVVEPKPQPVAEPRRVQPTPVVESTPVTPVQPVVEKKTEPAVVVETPVEVKPVEEKPVVETTATATAATETAEQTAEAPKNPFVSSIQGRVQELRSEENSSKQDDNAEADKTEEQTKSPWYASIVRKLSKVRDAIFPETVEDDDISYN